MIVIAYLARQLAALRAKNVVYAVHPLRTSAEIRQVLDEEDELGTGFVVLRLRVLGLPGGAMWWTIRESFQIRAERLGKVRREQWGVWDEGAESLRRLRVQLHSLSSLG
jgi:hypothetical protein